MGVCSHAHGFPTCAGLVCPRVLVRAGCAGNRISLRIVSLGIIHSEFTRAHTHMVWYGMAWSRSPPLLPAAGPLPGLDARKKRLRRLELGGAPVALRFPLSAGRSEMIGCKRRSYAKADSHPPPRRRGSCWLRDRWPVGWPCLVDPPRSDRCTRPLLDWSRGIGEQTGSRASRARQHT